MPSYTIHELAEIAVKHFTTINRADSTDQIVVLTKESPEWLRDVVMEAHGSSMPDDLIYAHIRDVIDALADDDSDPQGVISEMEADVYTRDLIAWLASDVGYTDYMTQAIEEYGAKDGFSILSCAQKIWMDEIGNNVITALEAVELSKPMTPEELTEAIRWEVSNDPALDLEPRKWYDWTFDGTPTADVPYHGETDPDWPALPYKQYDL